MRWLSFFLLPAVSISLASCATQPPAPAERQASGVDAPITKTRLNEPRPNQPIVASAAPSAPAPATPAEPAPIPPKGAQYTIFCRDFAGPMHVDYANQAKNELIHSTRLRGWYVLHLEDHSTLMYGYYKSIDDKTAKSDREQIAQVTDSLGNKLFKTSIVVPIDAPDPTAPPDWNLTSLRSGPDDDRHYWSLQIAAFRDNPQRKQAAVEMVRELRAAGEQAFYYHGDSVSSVCVGCWPMNALKKQDAARAEPGNPNPDQKVFVSPVPLPRNVLRQYERQGITVVQPEIEVVDPSMKETMNRFPQHFVNYEPEGVVVNGKTMPKPSAIVPIPLKPASMLTGPNAAPPSQDAVRALSPNPGTGSTGTGRLKGVK